MQKWFDLTTAHNTFDISGVGSSVAPAYHATGGSHGGEWVDFSRAGGVGDIMGCTNALGTNQPITVFLVHTDTCPSGDKTMFDTSAGARFWYRLNSTGDKIAAPSGVVINPSLNSGKWMVRTMVFNGATSYVRTNGVLQGPKINVGATGMGKLCLGNEIGGTLPYRGGMEYVLAYAGELNTNDLQIVENALINESHITP